MATSVASGSDNGFTGHCGVSYGDGHLYIAAGLTVRQVDPAATDWLTPRSSSISSTSDWPAETWAQVLNRSRRPLKRRIAVELHSPYTPPSRS